MPQQPRLRLGTSATQAATGSADWLVEKNTGFARHVARFLTAFQWWGRGRGSAGITGRWPSGVAHAVPQGTSVALCGAHGLRLWKGQYVVESRVLDQCAACAEAASR